MADVARVLKRMPKQSQHVLVQWCAWFPPHVFYARLVTVLVKVATNRLQAEQRAQERRHAGAIYSRIVRVRGRAGGFCRPQACPRKCRCPGKHYEDMQMLLFP